MVRRTLLTLPRKAGGAVFAGWARRWPIALVLACVAGAMPAPWADPGSRTLAVEVDVGGHLPAPASVAVIRPSADPREAAVLAETALDDAGRARLEFPRRDGLLLACRLGRELLVAPVPAGETLRLDLRDRRMRLRVVDDGTGEPLPGALATCVRPDGRPAPLRVFWLEGGGFSRGTLEAIPGTEAIPFEPGMIAVAGGDGLLDAFLPAACPRVRVSVPRGGGDRAFRETVVDARPGDAGVVRLARAGGVTLVPVAVPSSARTMTIAIFPWPPGPDALARRTVLTRALRRTRVTLPAGGRAALLVGVPGFAPVLVGPFEAREDWPEVEIRPLAGAAVRWEHAPPGAVASGRLLDERGRDWWPLLEKATSPGGALRVGPLPPGAWKFDLGEGACRGEVHVRPGAPGDVIVRCPPVSPAAGPSRRDRASTASTEDRR